MTTANYQAQFRNLRPDMSSGYAKPHKACLLLAVIDLIDRGLLTKNRVHFDSALKDFFSERFERYKREKDNDDPSMPYFYLSSSEFWHLVPKPGAEEELQERLKARKHGGPGVVARIVEYAHLDEELFQILQHPVYRAMMAGELEGTLITTEQAFSSWCRTIGKSEKTVANYLQALKGSLSHWASSLTGHPLALLDISSIARLNDIKAILAQDPHYKQRNTTGKGMYSAALNLYLRFIEEKMDCGMEDDIRQICETEPDSTVRESLVNARRGQGLYRARVMAYWNNRCALTGYSDPRFLLASHIKPWRTSNNRERLDRFNGFPFIPSIDKAFDIGYISFDSSGSILISSELETPESLGIFPDQKIQLARFHQFYLEFHRTELFVS